MRLDRLLAFFGRQNPNKEKEVITEERVKGGIVFDEQNLKH
jgi:hypothetical protein